MVEYDDEFEDVIDRQELISELEDLDLQAASALAELAETCHRVLPAEIIEDRPDEEMTKLGGQPDLPEGFEWPRHNGIPLSFLGQIDFIEDEMLVSFFYNCVDTPWGNEESDRGGARVYQFARDRTFVQTPPPEDLSTDFQFPEKASGISVDVQLPDSKSLLLQLAEIGEADIARLADLEAEQNAGGEPAHHLFGYPMLIQNDMEVQCELMSKGLPLDDVDDETVLEHLENSQSWILLFQIDSDEAMGWNWGDSGKLYYWIHESDLSDLNFDNTWTILQSH